MRFLVVLLALAMVADSVLARNIPDAEVEEQHSRNKRSLYLNKNAPILIAAFITLPISVAFGKLVSRSMRGFDNSTDELFVDSYDDPHYKKELQKLDMYFEYLQISNENCKQRFLCEISASPSVYGPVYQVFNKQLREEDNDVESSYSSRYFRYSHAFAEGEKAALQEQNHPESVCQILYGSCPVPATQLLSLTRVKILQFLTTVFKIRLEDV